MSPVSSLAQIETVYRERGGDFFRLALAKTGDRERARDAVQEGFARAIRGHGSYRATGSLDAWVVRCVINAARDAVRAGSRSPATASEPLAEGRADTADTDARDAAVEVLREAVARLPQPGSGRAGESANAAAQLPTSLARANSVRRLMLSHRRALAVAGALALVGVAVGVAVFPRSPDTSSGLSTISNRGTPAAFVVADKGWGKAYVLAEFNGFVYFRVDKPKDFVAPPGMTNRPTCYGQGKLRSGQVEVLGVDCSAFPSARTPVLKWVGIDVNDRVGGGTLLSVDGIAADGVAEMRLVSSSGRIVARAPVEENAYRFKGVSGLKAADLKLVAVDANGREVWSGAGGR